MLSYCLLILQIATTMATRLQHFIPRYAISGCNPYTFCARSISSLLGQDGAFAFAENKEKTHLLKKRHMCHIQVFVYENSAAFSSVVACQSEKSKVYRNSPYEPCNEKTCFLHMQKQRCRSAVRITFTLE